MPAYYVYPPTDTGGKFRGSNIRFSAAKSGSELLAARFEAMRGFGQMVFRIRSPLGVLR